ncbi:MAG: hypothetical protein WAW92_00380 [Minisyncoccia bacterium]
MRDHSAPILPSIFFSDMIAFQLRRQERNLPDKIAKRRGRDGSVIEKVVERKRPELCKWSELMALVKLLFLPGTYQRNKAVSYMKRFMPSKSRELSRYRNQRRLRAGVAIRH